MGILWTLSEVGPLPFRALQGRCETISPSVLSLRLRELQTARLIAKSVDGYSVTPIGQQVYQHLVPLGQTAKIWAAALSAS